MATPKLKLGNDKWATKSKSLLAYNDEGNNFKSLPFRVERLSGGSYVGRNGLIQYAATEEPRIDFTNYSKGALLLEPQRTNGCLYSKTLSSWTILNGGSIQTITDNDEVAPDGTTTASTIEFTGNGSSLIRHFSNTSYTSAKHSCSFWAKKISGNGTVFFGLTDTETEFTPTNEWVKYEVNNITPTNFGTNLFLDLNFVCSTGDKIAVWGMQFEAGTYSTSTIPTAGSAATRIADLTENDSIPGDLINSTEGTIFIDFEYLYETTSSSSTDANRDIFVLGTSADISEGVSIDNYRSQFRVFVQGSGMTTQSIGNNSTGAAQPNTRYKLAVKYKTGDCKAYLNGSLLGSGTGTVNFVTDLNGIFFSYNSSSRHFKNQKKVYDLQYFDTALTDAELTTLTTL